MYIHLCFILLNTYLGIIAIYNIYNRKLESIIILILTLVMNWLFITSNIFNFYILFEITLPLLFILIAIYGSTYRIKASYYIFIYTLFGSLFLLLGIILYTNFSKNINLNIFALNEISNINIEIFIYILIFIGFLVKIPLFPMHIWLSYAHSEAPCSGSIILAGIVLKLAIYGILILLMNLLPNAHEILSPFISWIAIFTLFYITMVTLVQNDTKTIVAYSSITHMSIVILGLFSNSVFGVIGAIILSIAHGLSSPGLFALVGDYIYKIYHTRIVPLVRGLMQYSPILAVFMFLFSLANISFPLTLNFTGEFLCLVGLKSNILNLTLSCFSILFSGLITFNLLTKVIYRDNYWINPSYLISKSQNMVLLSFLLPILLLGINSQNIFYNIGLHGLDLVL